MVGLLAGCDVPTSIRGVLRNASTSAVLVGVEVAVYPDDSDSMIGHTFTDAKGQYELAGLPDGNYRLRMSDTSWYSGATSWAGATPVTVAAPAVTQADAAIIPSRSKVTGTVTYLGAPLAFVVATAVNVETQAEVVATTSASSGAYQLNGVPSGPYRIRFTKPGLPTTYSGGATSWFEAPVVTLAGGVNVSGVNAVMTPPATIRGTLTDGGRAATGLSVFALTQADEVVAQAVATDGSFAITALAPGTYRLRVVDPSHTFRDEYWGTTGDDPDGSPAFTVAAGENVDVGVNQVAGYDCDPAVLHSGSVLSGSDLSARNLQGCDLSGADLRDTNLAGAHLSGADLSGADLTGSWILSGADLTGADLTGTRFAGANLTGVTLAGADVTGTDLTGAYMELSLGTPLHFDAAVYGNTRCPTGVNSDNNHDTCGGEPWMCAAPNCLPANHCPNVVPQGWWGDVERQSVAIPGTLGDVGGTVFRPADTAGYPGPRPLVVIVVGYNLTECYNWWTAWSLASHGYVTAIFTPTRPSTAATDTSRVIDFMASGANPFSAQTDLGRVGLVGHSSGASAVVVTQSTDTRVDAIVAYDDLVLDATPRVPALGLARDQAPYDSMAPDAKLAGYDSWRSAGLPAGELVLAGVTHRDFAVVGNDFAQPHMQYATQAWFDRWLLGDIQATGRLSSADWAGTPRSSVLSPLFTSAVSTPEYSCPDLSTC